MKLRLMLVILAGANLTGCATLSPEARQAGVTFGQALAVGLVRLASDEPRRLTLEDIAFNHAMEKEAARRGLTR